VTELLGLGLMGRRRCDDRTADRIVAALALIWQTEERWYGLAVWLSRSGMDRDVELLDRGWQHGRSGWHGRSAIGLRRWPAGVAIRNAAAEVGETTGRKLSDLPA
jgi:hypothetical protein